MQKENGFKWLFLDLNSYFASVEQQENPKLRGKPVAVVPIMTEHTCAIAASYEAKAYGVKTGTIIRDAHRMCPNLHCILAQHDKYVEYHHRIVAEISLHTPINKIWSIDELSSRLPPGKRTIEAAQNIAQNIREGLWRNVGTAINCSIGFAPNYLLAKIASDMKKPNGLTILRQEDLPGPLLHLQLTDLPGIGHNMKKRLNRAGIHTIEDLWNTSPKHARKIWNSVEGERFWYLLHGYDIEAQKTNSVMIGHSRVLDPELRHPSKARLITRRLLTKAAHRLRNKNMYARKIFLSIRTTDDFVWSQERKITPAQDPLSLLQNLEILWQEMLQKTSALCFAEISTQQSTLRMKKVSIILHGLVRGDQITDDLIDCSQKDVMLRLRKNESLTRALDKLHKKYEHEVVSFGLPPATLSGYVGTKIAFARVPEPEEFWE